jgi:hypothetical protein
MLTIVSSPSRRFRVTRRVDVESLIGAAEIAERLNLADPRVVHSWRYRYPSFPEPIASLRVGLIWSWPDVERWARSTGRV